jgi:hypothetical protein
MIPQIPQMTVTYDPSKISFVGGKCDDQSGICVNHSHLPPHEIIEKIDSLNIHEIITYIGQYSADMRTFAKSIGIMDNKDKDITAQESAAEIAYETDKKMHEFLEQRLNKLNTNTNAVVDKLSTLNALVTETMRVKKQRVSDVMNAIKGLGETRNSGDIGLDTDEDEDPTTLEEYIRKNAVWFSDDSSEEESQPKAEEKSNS